ncbi:MAG: putative molybdenum carrier protein [Planctomycetaceae bacterium]
MIVSRIVSGGQTGVDRAALDVALERGIACGGWCPRGRLAADGPIDSRYLLVETPAQDYSQRTAWNVRDSDGTLILTLGKPTGGTALTKTLADEAGKPCLVVDLGENAGADAAVEWIANESVRTLNVAGPRENLRQQVYVKASQFLREMLEQLASKPSAAEITHGR